MHYTEDQKKIMKALVDPSPYPIAVTLSGIMCTEKNDLRVAVSSEHACVYYNAEKDYNEAWEKGLQYLYLNYAFLLSLYEDKLLLPIPTDPSETIRIITHSRDYTISFKSDTVKSGKYYELGNDEKISLDFKEWIVKNKVYCGRILDSNNRRAYKILGGPAIASPQLKKLVKNHFKTTEEQTLCWTRIAAALALIGLILSLIINC